MVDPDVRDEIAAAALANQQLAPGYDEAIAANLVERIGAEIDRRVDARLSTLGRQASPSKSIWPSLALALGSIFAGLAASAIVLNGGASINSAGIVTHAPSSGQVGLDALIWAVLGVINLAFLRRH